MAFPWGERAPGAIFHTLPRRELALGKLPSEAFLAIFGRAAHGCSQRYPHPGYAQNYPLECPKDGGSACG